MADEVDTSRPRVLEPRYWNGPTGWLIGDAPERDEIVVDDDEEVDWPTTGSSLRQQLAAGSRESFDYFFTELSDAIDAVVVKNADLAERAHAGDLTAVESIVGKVIKAMRGLPEPTRVRAEVAARMRLSSGL